MYLHTQRCDRAPSLLAPRASASSLPPLAPPQPRALASSLSLSSSRPAPSSHTLTRSHRADGDSRAPRYVYAQLMLTTRLLTHSTTTAYCTYMLDATTAHPRAPAPSRPRALAASRALSPASLAFLSRSHSPALSRFSRAPVPSPPAPPRPRLAPSYCPIPLPRPRLSRPHHPVLPLARSHRADVNSRVA